MTLHTLLRCGFACSFFLVLVTSSAFGCSCREKESVCAAYGDAKAVFVGKVVEGKPAERMSDMIKAGTRDLAFKFAVSKAFLGAEPDGTIAVHTGFGFGDCGFPFQPGEEYVVYAYEHEGRLSTGICTRTAHISRAGEDLIGLEGLAKRDGASLTGTVTRYARSSLLGEPYEFVKQTPVRLIGKGGSVVARTTTNGSGDFSFKGLPTGKYRIELGEQKGWELDDYEEEEFLLNNRGCAERSLTLENDSEVFVSVVDPDGAPVKSVWVEFVPVGVNSTTEKFPKEFSVTNPQGKLYQFNLPPGRYTVSVNHFHAPTRKAPFPATFAPGVTDRTSAQVIEIEPGTKINSVVVKVPHRLEEVSITGAVVWPDGTPAHDVSVGLSDIDGDNICVNECAETDEQGRFTLNGYKGRKYSIWARGDKKVLDEELVFRYEGDPFTLPEAPQPVRITLKQTRN